MNNLKTHDYEIFVYCGGKCGSMSLYETFINTGYKCCQLHSNYYWMNVLKNKTPIFEIIENSSRDKKVYIIDSYRTPIERSISSFFQNINLLLPNYNELTVDEIIDWFNSNKKFLSEDYHPINEILQHYNVPNFNSFDFNKRYNIIEKDNKVFIKILFDDLNNWDKILSNIFNKPITIYSRNLTINKSTNSLYTTFKQKYKIHESYFSDYLINDNEFKIYNTIEQQYDYINKWNNRYKTLIGKDGYLFLQNDSGKELKIHNENLCLVKENFINRYNSYKNKFLLTIFPNKSLLYKDYLPDGFNMIYRPSFNIYNKHFNNNIIDGYDILKNVEDTFYKTDTHINLKGAYIIYCSFIEKIKDIFNITIEQKNISIHKKIIASLNELGLGIGDLTWSQNLGSQHLNSLEDVYFYSNDFAEIYLKYKISIDDPIRVLVIENKTLIDKTNEQIDFILNWDSLSKHILYKKNKDKPKYKCLIFYDSFLLSTLGLYLELFEEIYLSKSMFTKEIIDVINPDYIFEFRVERFLF